MAMADKGEAPKTARSRRLRVAGLGLALLVALGLVGMMAGLELSSTPAFCGTCHVMAPYYESWKTSTHNQVPCVECHIPPGITAEFRKKYEALSMVARYFTGTYGTNPWAEIDDASCLRCHEKRLLAGQELYRGILFDHTPHLTQMRRGKKLRCTSCHSQIVQGSHIAVTGSTCVLCHFKGQQLNRGTARCTLCHEVPRGVVERAGFRFDHADVARFAMDCDSCHGGSVRGDGAVPSERCLTCHNQPARLTERHNVDLMHRTHVTEHKVDCLNCHLEIQHGIQKELESVSPECATCHRKGHSSQQQLYAGIGGRGVEPLPATMFLAGIRCEGCHLDLPGRGDGAVKADDIACMSCHGPKYRKIFFQWKKAVNGRTRALRALVHQSGQLFRSKAPQSFQDALHNFRLVERGRGIHNVAYSFRLLDEALRQLNEARRQRGATALPRPWPKLPYESSCFACHQGIEAQAGAVFGERFSHVRHVVGAAIDCRSCHLAHEERSGKRHLRFGADGCTGCHHRREERDCRSCHGSVFDRVVASEQGEFSHELHVEEVELACSDCHERRATGAFERNREICAECH